MGAWQVRSLFVRRWQVDNRSVGRSLETNTFTACANMPDASAVAGVSHVIQLAVAPVFLLTGVGAVLSVLVNRLGRVVDRFRALDSARSQAREAALASIEKGMAVLSRRARLIHWAIGLCTCCALLVCIVIATLFVSSVIGVDLSTSISVLFILAMVALVAGLLCFLHEITLATGSIHLLPR